MHCGIPGTNARAGPAHGGTARQDETAASATLRPTQVRSSRQSCCRRRPRTERHGRSCRSATVPGEMAWVARSHCDSLGSTGPRAPVTPRQYQVKRFGRPCRTTATQVHRSGSFCRTTTAPDQAVRELLSHSDSPGATIRELLSDDDTPGSTGPGGTVATRQSLVHRLGSNCRMRQRHERHLGSGRHLRPPRERQLRANCPGRQAHVRRRGQGCRTGQALGRCFGCCFRARTGWRQPQL